MTVYAGWRVDENPGTDVNPFSSSASPEDLFLSENTVKRHRTNVYQKLGVSSRQELIDLAKSEAPLD